MGYRREVIKGISWSVMLRGSTRLLTFARLVILARYLSKAQFGIYGIATLLLAFLEILTETGVNVFLVQHKGEIKEYIPTSWIVSMARGILISLLIVLTTPFIVSFFNSPSSYKIILLIAVVPFIRGFINPAEILYQKELHFDREFWFRTFLFFVEIIVSIISGIMTRSAVCFIYGLIASVITEVVLSYSLFPIWIRISFEISKIHLIVSRGWWVTVQLIFSYFAEESDNIAVGRIMGIGPLGVYQIAYNFAILPISEIADVVNKVIFPVFVKFSDDKKRLFRALLQIGVVNSAGAILLGGVLFIFAKEIVTIVMGPSWADAASAIRVLSVYGILRSIFGNFAPMFLSIERQDYVAKTTFYRLLGLLTTIVPFVYWFGLVGAGFAQLVSILTEIPVILFFAARVFRKNEETN